MRAIQERRPDLVQLAYNKRNGWVVDTFRAIPVDRASVRRVAGAGPPACVAVFTPWHDPHTRTSPACIVTQ